MSSGDTIPIRSLPSTERVQTLNEMFAALFNEQPEFYVRMPGRYTMSKPLYI